MTSLLRERGDTAGDSGFSLIEVLVALSLLVTVMATTAGFFTTSLKQSTGQTQAQEATVLASQQLDYTRSVAGTSLLAGRTLANVAAKIATPPAGVDLSQDVTATGNYDTGTPPASTEAVPISMSPTVNGTLYTMTTFIDQCYLNALAAPDCKGAVTSFGWVYRITVDVTYQLGGGRTCANAKPCYYVASTLRDPGSDPCFNVNVAYAGCSTSQPTITSISPNTVTTNTSTTVTLTGTNFDPGATVSLDTGGTVSNVNRISATTLTFTLTSDNTPAAVGTRTVKLTNPNGKFAYGTLTITSSAINVATVRPTPVNTGTTTTMTIAGSGFQSGSVVSIPSTAGTISGVPTITANAITISFTASSSASAIGTWAATVTNPDGNSGSANFVVQMAPVTLTAISPSSMAYGSTRTFTLTGTGFGTGATVRLDGTTVATSSITSTAISLTLSGYPARGDHTFSVTNPDGGFDTGTFTVGGATITGISPTRISHGGRATVTITGTGFVISGATTPTVTVNGSTSGVSKVTISSTDSVTFRYKITSAKGTYTYPVQVTSKDGSVSDSYIWVVTSY